jgi:hypothetical protein
VGIDYAYVTGTPQPPVDGTPREQPFTPAPVTPAPPVARPLKLAPKVTKVKLSTLLKSGLAVKPGCEAACRATVVVAVDKATAKRLKLRSIALGNGSGSGRSVIVKLDAKARKALRNARSVKAKVAIIATAADGRTGTANQSLTIMR